MKTLEKAIAKHIKYPGKTCNICVEHMQHPNKHTCNIRLKKQMKHLERALATYLYNHGNMCNIPIYFCNIRMKHLQHTSETFETLKIDACNM